MGILILLVTIINTKREWRALIHRIITLIIIIIITIDITAELLHFNFQKNKEFRSMIIPKQTELFKDNKIQIEVEILLVRK